MKNFIIKYKNKLNIHIVILYMIILILIFIIIKIKMFSHYNYEDISITNVDIEKLLEENSTRLIYVFSSNNSKCEYCSEIYEYLEEREINYVSYDVENVTSDNYFQLLEILDIDKDIFGYPSLIYIKEGEMFANIIHIDDMKIVKQFISDYDLNLL